MKRIDVYVTPGEVERSILEGRTIVVVDVLRSCTSIAHALENGAAKVIPVESIEGAARLAQTLDPKTRLLCGERDGRKVDGFDVGNSPGDYGRDRVAGKTLLFASTNASPLIAGTLEGHEQRLAGFVNVSAVAEAVRREGKDAAILCAGRNGRFSLEDAACAGALVQRLLQGAGDSIVLNDAAQMARSFDAARGASPEAILRASDHGRYLIELGFEADLRVCAAVDALAIVPHVREGRILASADGPHPS